MKGLVVSKAMRSTREHSTILDVTGKTDRFSEESNEWL